MTNNNENVQNELTKLKLLLQDKFVFFVTDYEMIENCLVNERKSIHYDQLPEFDKRLDFTLEISYTNLTNSRKVTFRYSDGHNAEKTIVNSISLQISKIDEKIPVTYNIEDYAKRYNFNFRENRFFVKTSFGDSFLKVENYIKLCIEVFSNEELKRILGDNYWINLPIDMSPYK